MTYNEWKELHAKAKAEINRKKEFKSVDKLVEYFRYDNMVKNEPDFCPLYKDNIKCHNVTNLNCYYCGCPFFKVNDTPNTTGKTTIASTCIINSKYKSEYYENPDDNNVVKIHCDCSNCYIPHKDSFTKKYLEECMSDDMVVTDHVSMLAYIRKKQLKY